VYGFVAVDHVLDVGVVGDDIGFELAEDYKLFFYFLVLVQVEAFFL
jgi:hypothetical protein